jgi:4-carboxymuconolactone decarboxylase
MSADRLEPLPPRSLEDAELAALRAPYETLIGFVPPRTMARTEIGARLDPELLRLQEAARPHAIAARRAGASREELSAVAGLTYLFRSLPDGARCQEIPR